MPKFGDEGMDPAELGRKGAERSAEVRRRRSQMSPAERALEAIRDKSGRLTDELLHLALGEEGFEDASTRERAQAIFRCMDYVVGKPTAGVPTPPAEMDDEEDDEPSEGLVVE